MNHIHLPFHVVWVIISVKRSYDKVLQSLTSLVVQIIASFVICQVDQWYCSWDPCNTFGTKHKYPASKILKLLTGCQLVPRCYAAVVTRRRWRSLVTSMVGDTMAMANYLESSLIHQVLQSWTWEKGCKFVVCYALQLRDTIQLALKTYRDIHLLYFLHGCSIGHFESVRVILLLSNSNFN